jgi:Fe2+ transport system protein FeoA
MKLFKETALELANTEAGLYKGQTLADAPTGSRVRITGYRGGRMLRARLLALGLNLGREVEVLQNNRGLIIVGVNGGRIALGRGITQKITTEAVGVH